MQNILYLSVLSKTVKTVPCVFENIIQKEMNVHLNNNAKITVPTPNTIYYIFKCGWIWME
jgi:BRCT domain type II-containing protein